MLRTRGPSLNGGDLQSLESMYPPPTTATSAASPSPPINQDLASTVLSFAGDKCQPTNDVAALALAAIVNQDWP